MTVKLGVNNCQSVKYQRNAIIVIKNTQDANHYVNLIGVNELRWGFAIILYLKEDVSLRV